MSRPLKTKDELKEETRKVLEEEQEEFKKAAEKTAAKEEKELEELDTEELLKEERYLSPRDRARQKISDSTAGKAGAEEDVFEKIEKDYYESRKKEREKERKFEEEFGRNLKNLYGESSDYITERQAKGKIAVPEKGYGSRNEWYEESGKDFEARYNAAEDYAMSEGKNAFENTVKGMFNRFRSAPGEAIEDVSYFLNDNIQEDAPGKATRGLKNNTENVVEKNMAGNVGNKATEQFDSARSKTGAIGKKLIDVADSTSAMLGYGTFFGPSNLALSQSIGGGLDEYRNQRENGADKSEALTRGGLKGVSSYLIERLGGLGADNSAAPKVKFSDVVSVTDTILKTAAQEGGEGFAEYTVDSFIDTVADAIYKGKLSIGWNVEEALDHASTDMLVGGLLSTSSVVNGRDIDIVEEMNKIINKSSDADVRAEDIKDLKTYLGNRKKAKQELDALKWYLDNADKTHGVENVIRNNFSKPVFKVNHSTVFGSPNSITQKENKKGGIVRNYYDGYGNQYKQLADNNENHEINNLDIGGIHAHNYAPNEKGVPEHKDVRKLSVKEIIENGDLIWKYLN